MNLKILLLFCFLLVSAPAAAEKARARIMAPILLDKVILTTIWVFPPTATLPVEVSAPDLLNVLKDKLKPEFFQAYQARFAAKKSVTLEEVRSKVVELTFQEENLELNLTIAPRARITTSIAIRSPVIPAYEKVEKTADWSGYLNVFANQGFDYPKASSRAPLQGSLQFINNFQSVVLESGADYTEKANPSWRRQDTRIVKDFEEKLLRTTAGDLQVTTTGYQNAPAMGGLAVSRNYSIQPYLVTRPVNRTEFILQRASWIEVFVNGNFTTKFWANPGTIKLSDFPLFNGLNKVDLKISDETGKFQWMHLNLLFDPLTIGEGVEQYAYHAGSLSTPSGSGRTYGKSGFFSGFHRYGFSDSYSAGLNAQASNQTWMAGMDHVLLTSFGTETFEVAYANTKSIGKGEAFRYRFRSLDYQGAHLLPMRFSFTAERLGKWFLVPTSGISPQEYSWRFDAYVNQSISSSSSVGFGAVYALERISGPNLKGLRSDLSLQLARAWRFSANYAYDQGKTHEQRFYLALNWMEPSGNYFSNLTYDYPSKITRAEVTRNATNRLDDYRATAALQKTPLTEQADLVAEYSFQRATLRVDHSSVRKEGMNSVHSLSNHTNVYAASALAWADGTFAFSRTIADSFAILKTDPGFRAFEFPVNPVTDGVAEARINSFGPGVLTALSSYNYIPISVSSRNLPLGYSLAQEFYVVRPTYRSGTLIRMSGDATTTVSGKMVDHEGKPLALIYWEAKKQNRVFPFFTNKTGNFYLEGLSAGSYLLEPQDSNFRAIPLEIQSGQTGLVKIPPMIVERSETQQ